jgi:DNA polymerase
MTVYVDFETKSHCDLPKRGTYNYAQDGSTDVLCMAYAFDDEDVQLWLPGQPFPDFTGHQIRAHNAAFERLIFWYVLQQNIPLEAFYCTAAQARANCLPGSLEDVGRAISSAMRKDYRGAELVRKCCLPPFNTELLPELYAYCLQDVRTMRAVSKSMRDLSAEELRDYHINERINDRGVLVDVELCKAAVGYSAAELEEVQAVFTEITGLASVRSPKMRQWVQDRVGPEALKLMTVYKDGIKKMSVDKSVRASLLLLHEENPDEVSADVAEVLMCADDVWASSVAKFNRLAALADEEDDRVRGAFVFAGGAATGRASSYGAQVHNFTRKCAKAPEDVRQAMVRGHQIVPQFGKRVSDVLKGMLRPALIPKPGHVFVVADWAAIEGRVTPWLADNQWSDTKLDIFRSKRDPYKVNAAATFHVPYEEVTGDQRQIGKVQELALGFSGGVGAFASMGRAYGVLISDAEAQKMVQGWRKANPWAMPYWCELEDTYRRALRNKGIEFRVGRVVYLYDGQHLWYMLPSGRVLCYPFAKFDGDEITYLKAAWKPAADAKEWPRARLWRGLACENITQATANDLLRHSLRQLEPKGVVLHIHDEIVIECPTDEADALAVEMERIMCDPPAWAVGLPLAAEVKIMQKYGKG